MTSTHAPQADTSAAQLARAAEHATPMQTATQTSTEAASSELAGASPAAPSAFNWPLFGLLAGILVLIAASNVWLRLRASDSSLGELVAEWRRNLLSTRKKS